MARRSNIGIPVLFLASMLVFVSHAVAQDDMDRRGYFNVRSASTKLVDGVQELDARLQLILSADALAALDSGVPLTIELTIGKIHQVDHMLCSWRDGLIAHRLLRVVGGTDNPARREETNFYLGPYVFPDATYPEVLLPFLMRGQPRDDETRALYSWSSDRFVARVYYEARGDVRLEVPAGEIDTTKVWMYPDLNDWVALGSILTRLAKPLLPRYEMFFEKATPHRVVRFEGPFGPPGAPEMIIELVG